MSDPIRDLREMDQLVYQMQTAGTPDQLRSAVQRAWAITEKRMRAESNRITELLEPELRKVYGEGKIILEHNPSKPAPTRFLRFLNKDKS